MNEWAAGLQAVHLGSCLLLLGEAVFVLVIARPALSRCRPAGIGDADRRWHRMSALALLVSLASGAAWVVLKAAVMSGQAPGDLLTGPALGVVLGQTAFGRVALIRAGLAAGLALSILGLCTLARRRSPAVGRRLVLVFAAATLAAAYLGSLAAVGHAAADGDPADIRRVGSDVAHLLAAGCWLGALPGLVFLLRRESSPGLAADAARRFTRLGMISVALLTASGLVNAWHLVGSVPGLVGTRYGHLLVVKLALFAAMLGLAAVNRGIAAGSAEPRDARDWRTLRRNACIEIALGIGVIALAGFLANTVPAVHEPAYWPLPWTLSTKAIAASAWGQLVATAAGAAAGCAALVLVAGALGRPPRVRPAAIAGVVLPLAALFFLLAVPAHPTTYLLSPVPYETRAIAAGADLHAAHCARCHDPSPAPGKGDLAERVPDRREGDLFWSIAHGVPGTTMPAFADRLHDDEIWQLVQFLDARAAARNAVALADQVRPLRPVPAPDFTFEPEAGMQRSLRLPPDGAMPVTLLVFYALPASRPRLLELAAQLPAYRDAGARLIALPMAASLPQQAPEQAGEAAVLSARADPATARVYRLFAGSAFTGPVPATAHLEYLIDRHGYIRARRAWDAQEAPPALDPVLRQIRDLADETARTVPWPHRH